MSEEKPVVARRKGKTFDMGADTSAELSRLLDESKPITDDLIQEIPIKNIVLDPNQPRRMGLTLENPTHVPADDPDYSAKVEHVNALRELGMSIATVGLTQPVGVYPATGDSIGKHVLAWGERRVLASAIAGLKTIRAQVFARPPNLLEKQLAENMFRENPSLAGRLAAMSTLTQGADDDGGVSGAQVLQKKLGLGKTQSYNWWVLIAGPQDVREAVEKGLITSLKTAVTLAKIKDDAKRADAIARATGQAPKGDKRSGEPARAPTQLTIETKAPEVAKMLIKRLASKRVWEGIEGRGKAMDWGDWGEVMSLMNQIIADIEHDLKKAAKEGGAEGDDAAA